MLSAIPSSTPKSVWLMNPFKPVMVRSSLASVFSCHDRAKDEGDNDEEEQEEEEKVGNYR